MSRDCQARCHRCSGKHHVALCSVQHYPEYPITTRRARDSNQEQTVSTNILLKTLITSASCYKRPELTSEVLMEEILAM